VVARYDDGVPQDGIAVYRPENAASA
jgi:hypothetical protein